jgi:hypothetical protein
MKFWVIDTVTNKRIEHHGQERYAFRACVIFNAQELLNMRTWRYTVEPEIEPIPLEQLNLPDWALEVLNKVIEGKYP